MVKSGQEVCDTQQDNLNKDITCQKKKVTEENTEKTWTATYNRLN